MVTGLPRCGTSLLMSMLEAGGLPLSVDGQRPADRHNPRGYFENSAVLKLSEDASWLQQCRGRAIKILCRQLVHVPAEVPVRALLAVRDLREMVASQQAMLGESSGPPGLDWEDVFRRELERFRAWLRERGWPVLEVCHRDMVQQPARVAEQVADFLGLPLDREAMQAVVEPTLYRARQC